jgi:hypothetical protein
VVIQLHIPVSEEGLLKNITLFTWFNYFCHLSVPKYAIKALISASVNSRLGINVPGFISAGFANHLLRFSSVLYRAAPAKTFLIAKMC